MKGHVSGQTPLALLGGDMVAWRGLGVPKKHTAWRNAVRGADAEQKCLLWLSGGHTTFTVWRGGRLRGGHSLAPLDRPPPLTPSHFLILLPASEKMNRAQEINDYYDKHRCGGVMHHDCPVSDIDVYFCWFLYTPPNYLKCLVIQLGVFHAASQTPLPQTQTRVL